MPFANLHVHSHFSLLDGFGDPTEFAKRAVELGQTALAITDHGNLYGAVDHVHACKEAGIKPILGCEVYVAQGSRLEKPEKGQPRYRHLILLAQNAQGWKNLLAIQADASLRGYYYKPRTDREMLAKHSEGLIALSGCLGGELAQALLADQVDRADDIVHWYRSTFGPDRYYLEIQDHGQKDDQKVIPGIRELANLYDIPMVITGDSHYPRPEDAEWANVMHALQSASQVGPNQKFKLTPYGQYYLPSGDELVTKLGPTIGDHEAREAVEMTGRIADMIEPDVLGFGRVAFPELPWLVQPDETPDEALRRTCNERCYLRYPDGPSDAAIERVRYELGVIERMGFSPYFLIVYDYVNWARGERIVCLPRGSAAGSIILYLLGISDLDPIQWDLPFERFLNPDRVSMPDIDMDFPDDRRAEVLNYLIERYGRERVGQIVAVSKMKARASIKDCGRALGLDLSMCETLATLVPTLPVDTTIAKAIQRVPELAKRIQNEPEGTLVNTAQKLEGTVRHASTHASGAVVSAVPLHEVVPIQRPTKADAKQGLPVVQWDMHVIEEAGLIKFDLLGLSNLSMVGRALEYIKRERGVEIDLGTIPLDDRRTWEMLREGATKTVFQLEGPGMTRWLVQLKPSAVEHVAAMISLFRPGPMANIPSYIERRHRREPVKYVHRSLEPILGSTYGIVVYQEQVMAVARAIAGFTPGEADTLRKVMGKKQLDKISEQKELFLRGAEKQDIVDRTRAEAIWNWIEPFAGYGFNRSHAVAYAMLAYQTAYLKANYPTEWMAAVISVEAGDLVKTRVNLAECRRMGVPVLGPSVNLAGKNTQIEGDSIRLGLGGIMGLGATADAILREREKGEFRSLDDLAIRLPAIHVNKRSFEALAKAGALEDFARRSQIIGGLELALPAWRVAARARQKNYRAPLLHVLMPESPGITKEQAVQWEIETLGLSTLGHPYQFAAEPLIERGVTHCTGDVAIENVDKWVTIGGVIAEVKKIRTKTGRDMARVALEDMDGTVQVVVFPNLYEEVPERWSVGQIVMVKGQVDDHDGEIQLRANRARVWPNEFVVERAA